MTAVLNSRENSTISKITPGLSSLNLDIMFETDLHVINNSKTEFIQRLNVEHKIVHSVLQNMIGILEDKSSRGKINYRKRLENILAKDPQNLNALADIELLCRGLHRISEADRYKDRKNRILQLSTAKARKSKALCLCEQAYAILYDESANIEHIAKHKLFQSYKMLLSEFKKGKGKRKDFLQRGIYHNKQAFSNLQMAIECKRTSQVYSRKNFTSLEKFSQAYEECTVPNKLFWSFYEGVALNREWDTMNDQSLNEDSFLYDEMKDITLNATKRFWNIIKNMPPHNKINKVYIARSLALIGNILSVRGNYFQDVFSPLFTFVSDPLFKMYLENPIIPCNTARTIVHGDTCVLNRTARVLTNISITVTEIMKKELLHEAERILKESIAVDSFNWFAFSTRMSVRKNLALIYLNYNQPMAKDYLSLAMKDGYECFRLKVTAKSINILAQLCRYLAKFPAIKSYGSENVTESQKHYLLDALDYLNCGIQKEGLINFYLSFTMGQCLYDLGELKSAVDWMKRALSLARRTNNFPLKLTCLYMLKRYRKEKVARTNTIYLLKEIVYTMVIGENKYGKMEDVYTFLFIHEKGGLINVLEDIVTIPHILDTRKKNLIQDCLEVCLLSETDQGKRHIFNTCLERVPQVRYVSNIEPSLLDVSSPTSIPVDADAPQISEEFEYDFFVSHSHHDSDWVVSKLVSDLESALMEDDVVFKGCIADRDFKPGKFIFDNIERSIKKSYKVILILTEQFVDSYWCQFETNQALITSIESRKDCVIPLLLEECEIPQRLQHITYADFTNDDTYICEIMKLKKALLPGD